jgi:uncharacterized protein (TIRG00374 family)
VGHFLHAVGVFFHHLTTVRWEFVAFALACHVARLALRAVAWRAILAASYPESPPKLRTVFGAYVVGVGVNNVIPARGGDLTKLYLVRHRIPGATYTTLAPTLLVETLFDAVVGAGFLAWALVIGVLPARNIYDRLPTVDWRFVFRHAELSLIAGLALLLVLLVGLVYLRLHGRRMWRRFEQGFAILGDRSRFLGWVVVPQAGSWVMRIAATYFFLDAFHVPASIHNALLAQVVDSLSTLFPATPGGAGTKQGLTEYLFRGRGVSTTLLLAFSVGANIAMTVVNLLLAFAAIGLMARTLSFKRLRTVSRADRDGTEGESPA